MQIGFTQFSKRENSTKRPAQETFTFYNGVFKMESGILNPTLLLTLQGSDGTPLNPVNWNYAYIPDYKRYYYVKEWVTNNGQWVVFLSVDVMATYKEFIGTSTQYITRASAAYDGTIVDNTYPAKNYITHFSQSAPSGMTRNTTDGSFIVGIINGKVGSTGCVKHYIMDFSTIANFMTWLLTEGNYDFEDSLAFAVLNPIQYVTSCVYIPWHVAGANVGKLKVGWWEVADVDAKELITPVISTNNIELSISPHPQSAERGSYLNYAPFTKARLSCLPFGTIPIDLSQCDGASITARITCDATNGNGYITVYSGGNLIDITFAQIGTTIPMAQGVENALTSIGQSLGTGERITGFDVLSAFSPAAAPIGVNPEISSAIDKGMLGGVIGASAANSKVAGIGDAIKSALPQVTSVGSVGTFCTIGENMTLYQDFTHIVDEDNDDIGRPLMQKRVINTLSGYILVHCADLAIDGYAGELAAVKSYMEGGFFYE